MQIIAPKVVRKKKNKITKVNVELGLERYGEDFRRASADEVERRKYATEERVRKLKIKVCLQIMI